MKQLLTILFVAIITISSAQTDLSRIEGFRDFKWGSHVDSVMRDGQKLSFTPATKVDLLNGGKFYTLANDDLVLGSIQLNNIYYIFSDKTNRLYKVILEGKKNDVEQMDFIVDYKYGKHVNEAIDDDKISKQWIVADVTLSLFNFNYNKFEFELSSDWEAAEAYEKNTTIKDF
jgi:hypothetical protein